MRGGETRTWVGEACLGVPTVSLPLLSSPETLVRTERRIGLRFSNCETRFWQRTEKFTGERQRAFHAAGHSQVLNGAFFRRHRNLRSLFGIQLILAGALSLLAINAALKHQSYTVVWVFAIGGEVLTVIVHISYSRYLRRFGRPRFENRDGDS
jgi:hypothetical protein